MSKESVAVVIGLVAIGVALSVVSLAAMAAYGVALLFLGAHLQTVGDR